MRTNVKLDSVGALVECRHENPFELLGPHEIEHDGGKALAVRAFLPHSSQVWLAHGQPRRAAADAADSPVGAVRGDLSMARPGRFVALQVTC